MKTFEYHQKTITIASIVVFVSSFIFSIRHLLSILLFHGETFFGKSQSIMDSQTLYSLSEQCLMDAQYLLLFTIISTIVVLFKGRISFALLALTSCSASLCNLFFTALYFLTEAILPITFIGLLLITPFLTFFPKKVRLNPTRWLAWMSGAAVVSILTVFHLILITGLQSNIKNISKNVTIRAVSVQEDFHKTCSMMGLTCWDSKDNLPKSRFGELILEAVKQTNGQGGVVTLGIDARESPEEGLPAAIDEIFVSIDPRSGKVAADVVEYPMLRKKIVIYISLLTSVAAIAWQFITIFLMFMHQKKKDKRFYSQSPETTNTTEIEKQS